MFVPVEDENSLEENKHKLSHKIQKYKEEVTEKNQPIFTWKDRVLKKMLYIAQHCLNMKLIILLLLAH